MKKLGIFVMAAIMVMGLALSAQAVTINDPWPADGSGPELNLYQIVSNSLFGSLTFASSNAFASAYPVVETIPGGVPFILTAYATFADFQQNPGAYFAGDTSILQYFSPTFTAAFPADTDGIFAVTDWVNTFTTGVIGIFDDTTASGGDIKYTELALNSGALSQSNGLIFQISATQYIIAFEDGAGAGSLGDMDYNDLVLNVTTVPLPPSTLLLGSGLLGLVAWRRRIFG
jgi:hypothetical protein